MKINKLLLIFLPLLGFSQIHIDESWANSINPIFENLDKSKINSGILLEYAAKISL